MSIRRLLPAIALMLLLPSVALTPLAHASPSDSSWVSGIYDGGDHDDVINLITSIEYDVPAADLADPRYILLRPGFVHQFADGPLHGPSLSTDEPRAPPAS